jgi:hypothetical protein
VDGCTTIDATHGTLTYAITQIFIIHIPICEKLNEDDVRKVGVFKVRLPSPIQLIVAYTVLPSWVPEEEGAEPNV